jgi:hypothetical protein
VQGKFAKHAAASFERPTDNGFSMDRAHKEGFMKKQLQLARLRKIVQRELDRNFDDQMSHRLDATVLHRFMISRHYYTLRNLVIDTNRKLGGIL